MAAIHQPTALPTNKSKSDAPGAGVRLAQRVAVALAGACLLAATSGCQGAGADTAWQNLGDYLNFRNSFLNPAEVGRFDKASPFGKVQAVTWPILDQLDVVEAPVDLWAGATDPQPADLIAENKEFAIGPGDMIRLSIYDLQEPGREWFKETTVSETGTVDILYLGAVPVTGLTPTQANDKIAQVAIQKHALLPAGNGSAGPQVSVTVTQSRSRVFSILGLGSVSRPGTYTIIGANFRVLDAMALVGDVQVQPGLDYLYVIRSTTKDAGPSTSGTGATGTVAPPPSGNPLEAIESIEKNTTGPSTGPASLPPPTTAPASTGPGATGPRFVRPLVTASVVSNSGSSGGMLAQADLDAALTTSSAPASTAKSAAQPGAAATAPGDDLLNRAIEPSSGNHAFIGGKWVTIQPATGPAGSATAMPGETAGVPSAPGAAAAPPAGAATAAFATAEGLSGQRVIRIPLAPLRSGDPRYNIIIKPGDVINVPTVETGEFYMLNHVSRPGVFTLTGRKITLKMAVAAAGNLDALAIPRRCEITRRIGTNQEVTVQVNLQAIFDGEEPDIFLKPNDVVNVGTDMIAPFLAVTRNAYRLSYGFGFVYDRNFFIQPTAVAK